MLQNILMYYTFCSVGVATSLYAGHALCLLHELSDKIIKAMAATARIIFLICVSLTQKLLYKFSYYTQFKRYGFSFFEKNFLLCRSFTTIGHIN